MVPQKRESKCLRQVVCGKKSPQKLDKYVNTDGEEVTHQQPWYSIVVTAVVAFLASYAAFTGLHFLTGFGGGMLVEE